MKTLLRFTIGENDYGILNDTEDDANRYLNSLTQVLKDKNLLISMKRTSADTFKYELVGNSMQVFRQTVDESTKYRLSVYTEEKHYTSNSYCALEEQVYKLLDGSEFNGDPVGGICGKWHVEIDDGESALYLVRIIDDEGKIVLHYFDPLRAASQDLLQGVLSILMDEADDDDYISYGRIGSLKLWKYVIISCAICALGGILCSLIILQFTYSHTIETIEKGSDKKVIKEYLSDLLMGQYLAIIIGLSIHYLIRMINGEI